VDSGSAIAVLFEDQDIASPLPRAPIRQTPGTHSRENGHLAPGGRLGITALEPAALQRLPLYCPSRARTWTLLIQSQTCCQLHQGAVIFSVRTEVYKRTTDPLHWQPRAIRCITQAGQQNQHRTAAGPSASSTVTAITCQAGAGVPKDLRDRPD